MTTQNLQFNEDELQLQPGEEVKSVLRKHWFVFLVGALGYMVLFALPLLVLLFIAWIPMSISVAAYSVFFGALIMLVAWMLIFTLWTTYYLDIWIVTTERLIDIEQKALFVREIVTLQMDTVQDVQVDIAGVFQTFLNFGILKVQTAGRGDTDAMIEGIPAPEKERDVILDIILTHKNRRARGAAAAIKPIP